MKKLYRIFLLLFVLIILSTYTPSKFKSEEKKKNLFFNIKNIIILNTSLIKEETVKEKLSEIYNKNIFFVKKSDIIEPLKEIDFFDKIEVKKKYPNTILLKVFETSPVAILFKNKDKYLIDSASNLILLEDESDLNELPSVFGEGAENKLILFLEHLENNNFPIKKVEKFFYFQTGRWDLQLKSNQTFKLPYNKINDAINKSVDLLDRKDFKKYNIIDLRVPGKIIVE